MSERTAFVKRLKAHIDEWNLQIDKLEACARQDRDERAQLEQFRQLEEMHKRLGEAWGQVRKAQEAKGAVWNRLRPGFEAAQNDISAAFDKATKGLR